MIPALNVDLGTNRSFEPELMMPRIPEPELMDDVEQAKAYHQADFSQPHGERVHLFRERVPDSHLHGRVLDLGCGSGDIVFRLADAFHGLQFVAIDGSDAMLAIARKELQEKGQLAARIRFEKHFIPSQTIPKNRYAIVMSHGFLHHLHDPLVHWQTIKEHASPTTFVFVADLRRVPTLEEVQRIIDEQAKDEPEVLRRDYFNSLCAAYTGAEIRAQLSAAGIRGLKVEEYGERHVLVYGRIE